MWRTFACALLALVIFTGGLWAAEGVVVGFEMHDVVIKVGDTKHTVNLVKVPFVDEDGKKLEIGELVKVLKEGTKVDVTEKDGKITEVKIKKD